MSSNTGAKSAAGRKQVRQHGPGLIQLNKGKVLRNKPVPESECMVRKLIYRLAVVLPTISLKPAYDTEFLKVGKMRRRETGRISCSVRYL